MLITNDLKDEISAASNVTLVEEGVEEEEGMTMDVDPAEKVIALPKPTPSAPYVSTSPQERPSKRQRGRLD